MTARIRRRRVLDRTRPAPSLDERREWALDRELMGERLRLGVELHDIYGGDWASPAGRRLLAMQSDAAARLRWRRFDPVTGRFRRPEEGAMNRA